MINDPFIPIAAVFCNITKYDCSKFFVTLQSITVPNFMSKAFSYQDLCVLPSTPWVMTGQRYPGTDRIKFGSVYGKLEANKFFQRQSFTRKLRLALVFMWNSALRQAFNFCYSRVFCYFFTPNISSFSKIQSLKSFGTMIYIMFIGNNFASFYLWWKENLVKHQKTSSCSIQFNLL